jgi:hypothetical protein
MAAEWGSAKRRLAHLFKRFGGICSMARGTELLAAGRRNGGSHAARDKPKRDKPKQDKPKQDKPRQAKASQSKTNQGKPRQDKPKQVA